MAIECEDCGEKYDPFGSEPEDLGCPECIHEYWMDEGAPWTPKPAPPGRLNGLWHSSSAEDGRIALEALIAVLLRDQQAKHDRTCALIRALAYGEE